MCYCKLESLQLLTPHFPETIVLPTFVSVACGLWGTARPCPPASQQSWRDGHLGGSVRLPFCARRDVALVWHRSVSSFTAVKPFV